MVKKRYLIVLMVFLGVFFLNIVLGADPTWKPESFNITYYFNEDSIYYYNFTENLTDYSQLSHFSVLDILWSENGSLVQHQDFPWLVWNDTLFSNSTMGVLKLNSTIDNETGNFTINVHAQGSSTGQSAKFDFIINATNDNPNITVIDLEYNLSQGSEFVDYINASDEEEQYPLYFNISFFNNCTLAEWSSRTNCSLFSFNNATNLSRMMNFTPELDDVGTYWANISVRDFGENFSCPHEYCDNSTYMQNKTTSAIVKFNVFFTLGINASDCQNKIFQENETDTCLINITTKGESDSLNISSKGSIRNYITEVNNSSWFYSNHSASSSNFSYTVLVNVTPQKTEIGNWTINFTVEDTSFNETVSELIYVNVNRTNNSLVYLDNITDKQTSVNLDTLINVTSYDDDLLIPDKLEGYNETLSFNITILNQSNLSQELSLSNFSLTILNMPAQGTNRTDAKIQFTAIESDVGNYTINLSVSDLEGLFDSDLFNLSIISNQFPVWNQTYYDINLIVNSTFASTEVYGPIDLVGDGYVTDTGDTLTFTNSSAMPSFNLTSNGIIVFTPYKKDVGSWNITVTATDSLGLQNQTVFRFNITNINSNPNIQTPLQVSNATVDVDSNIYAQEDNYTVITLFIQDDDFMVSSSKKEYYNETLNLSLNIQGNNTNLFNFSKDLSFPVPGGNMSKYIATFIPNNTDIGSYNVSINVTDINGSSDLLEFNLTVFSYNDFPDFVNLTNQTSAVNKSFYYDINASDEEDGNDSTGNLTFDYNFLEGTDFLNSTTFNSTSGIINLTFNSSQGDAYKINMSVNDSTGKKYSEVFWIYVYGAPDIVYPILGENFTLQENITSNLTFRANHSVKDNLTYEFYINNSLKYNISYYGNDTNLTWLFTPNFTDETYGEKKNFTLIVYPSNVNLENRTNYNYSMNWNINISHTDSPVSFNGSIGDSQANYDQDILINLSNYFSDIDHEDVNYNDSDNFTIQSSSSSSGISSSISSDWILTLSASSEVTEILNITANDSVSSAISNNFQVVFTTPPTITVPTSGGGGGGGTAPVSLKILIPEDLSLYQKDRITVPLKLYNSGRKALFGINLSSIIVKNNEIRDDINVSFDKSYFDLLNVGEEEVLNMTVYSDTTEKGTFELTINATVENPEYNDWAKFFIIIKEGNNTVLEKLIFTEEFLKENPECIELEELLNEARGYFAVGDFFNTILKIQEAINGCKNAISKEARVKRKEPKKNNLYLYLFISTIVLFFVILVYYGFKRMKLKRESGDFFVKVKKQNNANKRLNVFVLAFIGLLIIFLFPINKSILGFAIKDTVFSGGLSIFFITFIFIVILIGFLLIYRKNKIKKIQEGLYDRSRNRYFK